MAQHCEVMNHMITVFKNIFVTFLANMVKLKVLWCRRTCVLCCTSAFGLCMKMIPHCAQSLVLCHNSARKFLFNLHTTIEIRKHVNVDFLPFVINICGTKFSYIFQISRVYSLSCVATICIVVSCHSSTVC